MDQTQRDPAMSEPIPRVDAELTIGERGTLFDHRRKDSEGHIHYPPQGIQTGIALCNMQWDGKPGWPKKTAQPATCSECLGIVESIRDAIDAAMKQKP